MDEIKIRVKGIEKGDGSIGMGRMEMNLYDLPFREIL